jgi:hypothetical protein
MNHPTREEWMSFIYGESSTAERKHLAAHLGACPDCRAQVDAWRGVRTALNAWPVRPAGRARSARRASAWLGGPLLKWAAVAVLLLGAGFGLGQFASRSTDAEKVRARIEPQIRQEMRREMTELVSQQVRTAAAETLTAANEQTRTLLANYASVVQARQNQDNQVIYATLRKVDTQRLADYILLKKQLDTVAVNTDDDLRRTRQQLIQLVDYQQPRRLADDTPK